MNRFALALGGVLLATIVGSRATAGEPPTAGQRTVAVDQADLRLSPYTWKVSGKGPDARAEAAIPGAYLKMAFRGSATVGLVVDGTANQGCPAPSMPVIEFSIDDGPYRVVALTRTGAVTTLPLAGGLDAAVPHRVEVDFRAADLARDRWRSSIAHLRLAGLAIDAAGTTLPPPTRTRRAIGFGDSITEGVGVDGLFTSWQSLGVNNARATWFPIACAALDCEYGQLGSGGHGMTRPIEMPPLPLTWDRYDPTTTRLTGGRLLPEPDYIFCALGTNDFDKDITADYTGWLTAMRAACPRARFFCVVPTLGVHETEVRAAVEARHAAGDRAVHLIDPVALRHAFRSGHGATSLAHDGVHPSGYGQALLGAPIAVEVQKVLSGSPRS
jgi:lysophospholipase L1-like esterase